MNDTNDNKDFDQVPEVLKYPQWDNDYIDQLVMNDTNDNNNSYQVPEVFKVSVVR